MRQMHLPPYIKGDLLPYQLLSDCWSYIDNEENVASTYQIQD